MYQVKFSPKLLCSEPPIQKVVPVVFKVFVVDPMRLPFKYILSAPPLPPA